MADSGKRAIVEKWRRWKRENRDWPLTVAGNGQWCKKIRGRIHYFGPLEERDIALNLWLAEKDYLLAGEDPPRGIVDRMTINRLIDKAIADVESRHASGDVSIHHCRAVIFAARFARKHLAGSRQVESLRPEHFAELRLAVAATGRSLRSQADLIARIRGIFLWGTTMSFHPAVQFGPRFKPPGWESIAREREASGKTRFVGREDILALLAKAYPAMKCMILLGINGGFYPSDSICLTFDRLHLDHETPHHDFARVKTGRRRMAVLWPETVATIREYIDQHRHPKDKACRRVLLNQYGQPFAERASSGAIPLAFGSLLRKADVTVSPGTSIGSLRHTYGTVVDLAPDQQMIDLTMGHAPKGLQKRIYSQLNLGELDRLAAVAEIVRRWLYFGEIAGVSGAGKGEGAESRAKSKAAGRFRVVG